VAARTALWWVDFPVVNELERLLFKLFGIGAFPIQIVYFLLRADVLLRIAVAV
jgi:hypothetical protein